MPKRLLRVGQNAMKRLPAAARHREFEKRRQKLLRRLTTASILGADPRLARRALTLLNQRFRYAKLAQRAAVLTSAEWIVKLIEAGASVS